MAKIKYEHPVAEISGALAKHGIVSRRKIFRDDNGKVIFMGTPEAYAIRHPRDWNRNPATGNELEHHNRWKQACIQAYAELHDEVTRADWQKRFSDQLTNVTPDTPVDSKTGIHKHYHRLDAFVRAVIYARLKAAQDS